MRFRKPLASTLVIAVVSATALAVVIQHERTPENPGDFSVTSEMGKDGLVHFSVTCKVARPCWIKAYLLVRKGETRIVETYFPAVVREDSIEYSITYNFAISPEYLDDSTLELAERGIGYSVNPADERHPLPGTGGTDNVFPLKKFAPKAPAKETASPANADYTPNDVLERIGASQKLVSNATFESVWKIFDDGPNSPDGKTRGSTRWERQTFYWDDLGRRRVIVHGGLVSQDGKMLEDEDPSWSDDYFTGEIMVSAGFHPKWDRQGGKPASPKDAEGYNNVIIADAVSGLRQGLESLRNPLEYMYIVAANIIAVAVQRGDGTVRRAEDGRLAVDIKHTDPDNPYAKTVVTVIPQHNWAVESLKSYLSDGNLAREIVCQYKKQADGLWVPIQARHTHWGERKQSDTPYWIWSFEVTKGILNDPSFDQHVFDVRLKPDTWVSDTRYNVSYRIGSEEAVASQLPRYAEDALKAEKNRLPKP